MRFRESLALAGAFALGATAAAAGRPLALRHVPIDLPAAPAAIVPADLDGDGQKDLLIVVAYTNWESIGGDRIEGLTQIAEVVPALFDRREAWAFLSGGDGSYRPAGEPLPLPVSVLAVEAGPPAAPVLALTDDGPEALRLVRDAKGERLSLDPLADDPPVHAGSGAFLGGLRFVHDVDGDGRPDLLLPARDGIAIYRGEGSGIASAPAARLPLPGDERFSGRRGIRLYPLPRVADLDGDRVPDLLVRSGETPPRIQVLRGEGGAKFGPPIPLRLGCLGLGRFEPSPRDKKERDSEDARALAFLGDLEGDARVEAVTRARVDTGKGDLKQEKEPHFRYRFHRVGKDFRIEPTPYQETEIVGHPFGDPREETEPTGFRDLDGDGRMDLVTLTLDFSMFQIARAVVTKKIGIGIEFHVYAQGEDGRFREIRDRALDDRFTIDLNDVKLDRLAEFAGDFDGDGRIDFVRLGRGRTVAIHRGGPGCRYPGKPDLEVELEEPLESAAQVQVRDLDGDGRADLAVVRPLPSPEPDVTAPVRLDLYLSRGEP
jgi:hypothetical protein